MSHAMASFSSASTSTWFVLFFSVVGFVLGLFPVCHHLLFGLRERKREIVGYFDPISIKTYYEHFYRGDLPTLEEEQDFEETLGRLYDARFGARTFVLPFAIFIVALALLMGTISYGVVTGSIHWPEATLQEKGLYALAGAYLWVVSDLISRYRQRDLVPSVLYWYVLRFLISVPTAYVVSAFFSDWVAPPIAFSLGVFPTSTLMLIMRRQAAQRLGLGDDATSPKLELEVLQGVNTTVAETFAEVGVTTMLQLAYADPIQLAMRTNLQFAFVVDLISQALANVYGLTVAVAQRFSIRGSIEAAELHESLRGDFGATDQNRATAILTELANAFRVTEPVMRKLLEDIYNDPYNELIRSIWA